MPGHLKKKPIFVLGLIFGLAIFSYIFSSLNLVKAEQVSTSVTIQVTVCGNNIIEQGEQCDGTNLAGKTCQFFGYTGGALSCNPNCTFNTNNCTSGGGGGGGGAPSPPPAVETKVIIKGLAYPDATITLLQDGKTITGQKTDESGNFKIEIEDITQGLWTFTLWAEDKKGRRSISLAFTSTIIKDMTTTVSGIILPPTIELTKDEFEIGEILEVEGQAAPKSEVAVHFESKEIVKKTKADAKGDWQQDLDTQILDPGIHTVRAKTFSPDGLESIFSQVLSFVVTEKEEIKLPEKIRSPDFNHDGKVNLIDFSILLYNWGLPKNIETDLNYDNKVDLKDFSIMLYYWTG